MKALFIISSTAFGLVCLLSPIAVILFCVIALFQTDFLVALGGTLLLWFTLKVFKYLLLATMVISASMTMEEIKEHVGM